jgi:hypothetical protein
MTGWLPGVDAFSTAGFSTGNGSIGIPEGLYPRESRGYPHRGAPRSSAAVRDTSSAHASARRPAAITTRWISLVPS